MCSNSDNEHLFEDAQITECSKCSFICQGGEGCAYAEQFRKPLSPAIQKEYDEIIRQAESD